MQDNDLIQAVLADWRAAPVREEIRATLGFLEKLALRPDEVSAEDIAPLRRAGVSDEGIEEAIAVCTVFNVAVRVADSFNLEPFTPEQARVFGQGRLQRGYKPPAPKRE
jgi:alkylhydroperoxidase family enzyme